MFNRVATVQIRNVPPELHKQLKRRALERNESLSAYLLEELRYIANKPTLPEFIGMMRAQPQITVEQLGATPAEIIQRSRAER